MRGPGGGISPARPRAEAGSPSPGALRSSDTAPPRGRGPTALTGQPSPAVCGPRRNRDRAQPPHGAGTADRRAPPPSRPAGRGLRLIRRARRCPGRAGQRLCPSRPRGKLPAAEKTRRPRRRAEPRRGALGRTASRSPRSRTSLAVLLPLLTLLPRCAAAAPRRL